MKKFLLLIFFVVFLTTGCAQNEENNVKVNVIKEKEEKALTLGDIAETDIARFRLLAGEYTYALINTNNNDYAKPKEYDAQQDSKNPYVAAKGRTLVAYTFSLENLDRTWIDVGGMSDGPFITIKYNNKTYGGNNFVAQSLDNLKWKSYRSPDGYPIFNILIESGKTEYYRGYIDAKIEVENLEENLELIVELPNSSGKKQKFKYIITEEDRSNYNSESSFLQTEES